MDELRRFFRRSRFRDASPRRDTTADTTSHGRTKSLTSAKSANLNHSTSTKKSLTSKSIPQPYAVPPPTSVSNKSHSHALNDQQPADFAPKTEAMVPPGTAISPDSPTNGVVAPQSRHSQSSSKNLSSSSPLNSNPSSRGRSLPRHKNIPVNESHQSCSPAARYGEDIADRNLVTNRDSVPPVPKLPQETRKRESRQMQNASLSGVRDREYPAPRPEDYERAHTLTGMPTGRYFVDPAREHRPGGGSNTMTSATTLPAGDGMGYASSMSSSIRRDPSARRAKAKNKFSSASYYTFPHGALA